MGAWENNARRTRLDDFRTGLTEQLMQSPQHKKKAVLVHVLHASFSHSGITHEELAKNALTYIEGNTEVAFDELDDLRHLCENYDEAYGNACLDADRRGCDRDKDGRIGVLFRKARTVAALVYALEASESNDNLIESIYEALNAVEPSNSLLREIEDMLVS